MSGPLTALCSAARPKFLILAPICVGLGVSIAAHHNGNIDTSIAIICVLIALFAHISVNLLNEYEDAKSGLDDLTLKTPFSGGSGALQTTPSAQQLVQYAGWLAALITALLGLYLAVFVNTTLVLMGALGLLTIVLYTPWLNRFPYLCLIAPGVGFGLIMVNGTYIALTSQLSLSAFVLSLIVFCLVNNLLLLNQFPDAHADKQVGRNHFVIAKGFRASAITYIAFVAVCFALVVYLLLNAYLPSAAWWILISLPIGLLVGVKAMRLTQTQFDTRISELLPYMGLNVMLSLCVPLALALVLWMYR